MLEDFRIRLLKQKDEVLPSSLLGNAINYWLSQWNRMASYLEGPYMTPDNNSCENAMRPFVLGRKNWLFCKSPEGTESSCGMYSLIEISKQNRLIPINYLAALFRMAPLVFSNDGWQKPLPWNIFTA